MWFWVHIGWRCVHALIVFFGVTLVTFVVARLLPGNPAYLIAGRHADEQTLQEIIQRLGLDQPIPTQYLLYMQGLLRGDLGEAWTTSNPVTVDIAQRFPATLELSLAALCLALVVALPLGIVAALRPGSIVYRIARALAVGGVAIPQFWFGLLLVYLFFFRLRWMPPPMGRLPLGVMPPTVTGLLLIDTLIAGDIANFWLALKTLVMPSITLALAFQAPILQIVQTTMAEALQCDAVRTARALGVPRMTIISNHALRLVLPPLLTMIGITFGYLLGGTVLVERVFTWPGIGMYALQAVNSMDYAAIQGVVLVTTLFYLLIYFVIDVLHVLIDPRVRLERAVT